MVCRECACDNNSRLTVIRAVVVERLKGVGEVVGVGQVVAHRGCKKTWLFRAKRMNVVSLDGNPFGATIRATRTTHSSSTTHGPVDDRPSDGVGGAEAEAIKSNTHKKNATIMLCRVHMHAGNKKKVTWSRWLNDYGGRGSDGAPILV